MALVRKRTRSLSPGMSSSSPNYSSNFNTLLAEKTLLTALTSTSSSTGTGTAESTFQTLLPLVEYTKCSRELFQKCFLFMKNEKNHFAIRRKAAEVIRTAANKTENALTMIAENAIETLVQTMKNAQKDPKIIALGCGTLEKLAQKYESIEKINKTDIEKPIAMLLLLQQQQNAPGTNAEQIQMQRELREMMLVITDKNEKMCQKIKKTHIVQHLITYTTHEMGMYTMVNTAGIIINVEGGNTENGKKAMHIVEVAIATDAEAVAIRMHQQINTVSMKLYEKFDSEGKTGEKYHKENNEQGMHMDTESSDQRAIKEDIEMTCENHVMKNVDEECMMQSTEPLKQSLERQWQQEYQQKYDVIMQTFSDAINAVKVALEIVATLLTSDDTKLNMVPGIDKVVRHATLRIPTFGAETSGQDSNKSDLVASHAHMQVLLQELRCTALETLSNYLERINEDYDVISSAIPKIHDNAMHILIQPLSTPRELEAATALLAQLLTINGRSQTISSELLSATIELLRHPQSSGGRTTADCILNIIAILTAVQASGPHLYVIISVLIEALQKYNQRAPEFGMRVAYEALNEGIINMLSRADEDAAVLKVARETHVASVIAQTLPCLRSDIHAVKTDPELKQLARDCLENAEAFHKWLSAL